MPPFLLFKSGARKCHARPAVDDFRIVRPVPTELGIAAWGLSGRARLGFPAILDFLKVLPAALGSWIAN
jgi:hypothetical protein